MMSDTSEARGRQITGPVVLPAWGMVTLRADRRALTLRP
jgi:hypothetical protein